MSAIGDVATDNAPTRGFTLIEMLVVLGIAGLIAGLGFPQLRGQMAAQEWRSSVAGSMATLRRARAMAIRTGGITTVTAAPGGTALRLNNAETIALPGSVKVLMAGPVRFAGDGSSTGGEVLVTGRGQAMRVTVAPATGLLLARPA